MDEWIERSTYSPAARSSPRLQRCLVAIELNPRGYLGGSISDTLRPLYGPTRVGLSADVIAGNWRPPVLRRVTCGRAWADLSLTFIRGAASSVENVVTSAEAACLRWPGLFMLSPAQPDVTK